MIVYYIQEVDTFMRFIYLIVISLSYCLTACEQGPTTTSEDVIEEEESLAASEMKLQDTLELKEGDIPEDWLKVELKKGYYVGFPKKPRQKEDRLNRRVDFKLRRNKYRLYTSITDLSKELSFNENRATPGAYYKAVFEDMSKGLELELKFTQPYWFQGIYEGARATLSGADVIVYAQCVLIGNDLFTFTLILFVKEHPVYDQLRDRFFYSFGKDLNIE